MKKKLILLSVGWLVCSSVVGQNLVMGKMSLEEAIKLAHTRSPQAQMGPLKKRRSSSVNLHCQRY